MAPRQAPAQQVEATEAAAADVLTLDGLEARRKEAEASASLEEGTRKRVLELYQRAADELATAAAADSRRAEHEQAINTAPGEQQKLRQELDEAAPETPKAATQAEPTLAELEQQVATREGDLAKLRARLKDQEAEPQRRADRRGEIAKATEALAEQLAAVQRELTAPAPDEGHPEIIAANKTYLTARKQSLRAGQQELEAELHRYDATTVLLPLRRDVAARRVAQMAQTIAELEESLNERRRLDADRQRRLAIESAANADPSVKRIAVSNAAWADQRAALAERIEHAQTLQDGIRTTLKELEDQFSDVKEKVELVGLTEANGAVLRKQRQLLPDLRHHEAEVRERKLLIGNVQLERLNLESERDKLRDIDERVAEVAESLRGDLEASSKSAILFTARGLLVSQRDALDALLADNNSYFGELFELQQLEEKLIARTQEYRDYIDERVLWIRSAEAMSPHTLADAKDAAQWLIDPRKWSALCLRLFRDLRESPVLNLGSLAVFLLAYRLGRVLRKRLRAAGEAVGKSHVTAFRPTLIALASTFLISVLWPAMFWYLAWRMEQAPDATNFDLGCATGLRLTGLVYLTMEFFRQVCRRHGLADAHFSWPQTGISIISRNMRWLMVALLPGAFVVTLLEYGDKDALRDSLGRFTFMFGQLALAVFMHRILRPKRGALAETYLRNPLRWSTRLQRAWHAVGVGGPIALAALAASGYFYTSLQLTWRLEATIWLIVGLLILTAVFVRWVQLARRAMAIRQAIERRAANLAAKLESSAGAPTDTAPLPPPDLLDLSFLSQQARRLLQSAIGVAALVGVWLIWVDVLPALRVLKTVEVWKASTENSALVGLAALPASPTTPSPAAAATNPDDAPTDISVTLADLLVAALIASMALVAAKNLPGLLEFTLLQRLPVESGAKFAIKTVASYVISVVGIVWTLKTVGVAWMHVQWLVAAISVGLGFGLQEIFGNFISGLIILFERPIRVGDLVTVGQTTGSVARIQIRATTILDGDRRELIVPNKDFITGQIVNWTLSDTITRVVLPVGIAYDSDAELAHRLLQQIARENPWVMKDPEPMAVMTGLGENALNFELRVFIATRDQHAPLVHSLNTTIAQKFQSSGIEIAYPQRDVRVRMMEGRLVDPALREKWRKDQAA